MTDHKLVTLLATQKSLTEWLEDIQHADAAKIRQEDNEKRERLKTLNKLIGLPFDKPTQFAAKDLREDNPVFTEFIKEHGGELCAIRLSATDGNLPKLRMRGKTIRDAYAWFKEQDIDSSKYKVDFVPHANDNTWSTIFVVNKHGIHGEIIFGGHHQLTQGFHDQEAPTVFSYDFQDWRISPQNNEALGYLKETVALLHVKNKDMQAKLMTTFNATFSHNYLNGYFETTCSESNGTWFIDYNQYLGELYKDIALLNEQASTVSLVQGQAASAGNASGKVHIVAADDIDETTFPEGAILVCAVTSPNYVPLMRKAAAIVTDQGGILSHAAIVARELKKPCVVGTGNATLLLANGMEVQVDATNGTVLAV